MPCSRITAAAIPDPGRLEAQIPVPALGSGSQLSSVQLEWTHEWTQDLTVELKHSGIGANWQPLWSGLGGSVGGGHLTLEDGAAQPISSAGLLGGSSGPFSRSDGQPLLGSTAVGAIPAGLWLIAFEDSNPGDAGSLTAAALCWRAATVISPSVPPRSPLPPGPPVSPPPEPHTPPSFPPKTKTPVIASPSHTIIRPPRTKHTHSPRDHATARPVCSRRTAVCPAGANKAYMHCWDSRRSGSS